MKKFLLLLLLLGGFTTAFCSGVLTYQVLKPAVNPLPRDVKTIAFVYRNIAFPADSITQFYKYNDETHVDTTNYIHDIVQATYMGFRSAVQAHYPLDTIPLILLERTTGNAARSILPMSWEKVNALCKQNNSDVLVSLDDIVIFNNYKTWYDGIEYNGIADISSFHSWTVYDPLTESFLFRKTDFDSLQAHETAYDLSQLIRERLPHREEIMKVVAFSVGENLAKKLVPQWETVYREYYNTGNKEMRTAAAKVKAEKWEEALKIWATIQAKFSGKYKARAAFNRAIVYERMGEIEKALTAVQQSIISYKVMDKYKKEKALAETLQKILEKRQIEIAQLKDPQSK